MIGEIDWFGQIVGGAADGEITASTRIAKALIRAGLAVVIIEPGGKKAVCTLSARDAKAADIAAQDKARAAGSPNWERVRHECGIKHAITDEKLLTRARVKKLLSENANLAVAPGFGERRIMIVDVDTEAEKRAFLEDWENAEAIPEEWDNGFPLTVSSPGVKETHVSGEPVWVHKDGGHFWFDIPEGIELPERPGKLTWCRCHGVSQPVNKCPRAWSAYYGSGYVLVPPSVRPEGAYRLTGSVHAAPEWLTTLVRESRTPERSEAGTGALSALNADDDPIDAWSAQTPWSEILQADGFTPHDHDTCGCPTFTRPGSPTHAKSVTAHEVGCTQYDTTKGHGPLHVWSDALGPGTMSKLTYVSKYRHNGDTGAAMRAFNIGTLSVNDDLPEFAPIPKGEAPNGALVNVDDDLFAPLNWVDLFAEEFDNAEHLPAHLCEKGQQIALIGDGKAGKSLFMTEWVLAVILGNAFLTDAQTEPLTVMYVDGENSRRDLVSRFRSLDATPEMLTKLVYLSFPPFRPLDSADGANQVMALVDKHEPDVVILDTVSRFIAGKENDSDTWLNLYRLLHRRLKARGIVGIRLDHFGKDAEKGGRGSSAKSQDIDHVWELVVKEEDQTRRANGIEVETILELKRTHTRTGLGPGILRLKRTGMKTLDERGWIPGATRHEIADAFDSVLGTIDEPVQRPVELMRRICETLSDVSSGMPLRQIREAIGGKASATDEALRHLIEEGFVKMERVGKSNMHTLLKPFAEETA